MWWFSREYLEYRLSPERLREAAAALLLLGVIVQGLAYGWLYHEITVHRHGRVVDAVVMGQYDGRPPRLRVSLLGMDREVPLRGAPVGPTQPGTIIPVRYDPADPTYAEPANGTGPWNAGALLLGGVAMVGASVLVYLRYRHELAHPPSRSPTMRSDLPPRRPGRTTRWGDTAIGG